MRNDCKWVIVTGASGGIGFATSKILLENNYGVIALGRNLENLEKKFESFENNNLILKEIDFGENLNIKLLLEEINEKIGKIYGFVHCAGIQSIMPINLYNLKKIKEMFEVNVFLAFEFVKYLSKKKYGEENGSYVLLSSLSAYEGAKGNSFYASTKGALEGFLIPATSELLGLRRLNIIIPGVIESGMGNIYINNLDEIQKLNLEKSYPLGLGTPEDVGNMVEYLLSDKAKWITGQKFILDGGHMATMR
ncbi:MAG: SDR family NAD(P)-dependent oxidoreductase [Cetobacterium sp.]